MNSTFTKMKLLIVTMLFTVTATAQINYTFNQSTTTFTPVAGATNAFPQVWDDDNQYVPIGFNFSFMGTTYTYLVIHSNGLLAFDTDQWGTPLSNTFPVLNVFGDYGVGGFGADLIDRGEDSGIPQSPVLYKTEGNAPNRVFIVEWKNAGFYDDDPLYNSYINVQAKLFEGTNNIQIIMGPNSVSPGLYEPGSTGPVIGLASWDSFNTSFLAGLLLNGTPSSAQAINSYLALNSTPAAGTVYNFIAGATAIVELKELNIQTFPNPVANDLFIALPLGASFNEVSIFDVNGRIIYNDKIETTSKLKKVDVSEFGSGIYNIILKGDESVGVAKFIK